MKNFDFYELVAVLCPGVMLGIGVFYLYPNLHNNFDLFKDISFGGTALGLIVAYILGQYIQFCGALFQDIFWCFFGGMPTTWINTEGKLFHGKQYENLIQHLTLDNHPISGQTDFKGLHSWLKNKIDDSNRKVYIVNSQYGMFRGLSCVWLALAIMVFVQFQFREYNYWLQLAICIILAVVSMTRMKSFGEYYAREIYGKYLVIAQKEHTSRHIPS